MSETDSLRGAVCTALQMRGIDLLSDSKMFTGMMADLIDADSPIMTVLYAHCDDQMMRPYSQAAAIGTTRALAEAAMRVEAMLHDDRRVVAEDARIVAWGIACGTADCLGVAEPTDPRCTKGDQGREDALGLAKAALLGGSETEARAALSALYALPKGDPAVEKMIVRVEARLRQITEPPTVTVEFLAPGATGVNPLPISCARGGVVVLPKPDGLSKGNQEFAGWEGAPGSAGPLAPGHMLTVDRDITLRAAWKGDEAQTTTGTGNTSKGKGGSSSKSYLGLKIFLMRAIIPLTATLVMLIALSNGHPNKNGSSTSHSSSSTSEIAASPVEADEIAAISAGSYHTFALRGDGKVYVTGINQFGEGNVSGWKNVVELSAGHYLTIALTKDGTVLAGGSRGSGASDVSGMTDVKAVAAGDEHAVVLRNDGSVVAKGNNEHGQCNVSDWTNIASIATGSSHTIGLRTDGSVVATGRNDDGQCNVFNWIDVVGISGGTGFTVALRKDGTVIATGRNDDGQCNVSGWSNIDAISAGWSHTVGLRKDGTVVATGDNTNGQCNVSDWTDIVAISAGGYHTVGLRKDGTVVATGYNGHKECEVSSW